MIDNFFGCFLGLVTGDAMGVPVEFKKKGSFPPITQMTGGGTYNLPPGVWSDDTSMALCLLRSTMNGVFNPSEQMNLYLGWYKGGFMSSIGRCFDIGYTTRNALEAWKRRETDNNPFCGPVHSKSAGNGSIMRLAGVPMLYVASPMTAIELAGASSKTTHGASPCVDACKYMAGIIVGALKGVEKIELLRARFHPVLGQWPEWALDLNIEKVANGSFKDKKEDEIKSTGYVVDTLETALWAFYNTKTFKDGLLKVVNLGGDTDTAGAVYGQIAGAFYGVSQIPKTWRDKIVKIDMIESLLSRAYDQLDFSQI